MEIIWEIVVERQKPDTNDWFQYHHLIKMEEAENFDLVEKVRMYCCEDTDDEIFIVSAKMLGAISEIRNSSWIPVKVGAHE